MKKIFGILFSLLLLSSAIKAQLATAEVTAIQQSGPHNYFGVKVTLNQTYSYDVTVTGYICDDGGGFNTNHPFTLTVPYGELTAETATNFYETDPTASATIYNFGILYSYAGVTIIFEPGDCILKFNSAADVNTVINQLNSDYDSYNDNYDSQYPNLTEDQLDDMDDQNDFDEFQKFKEFEIMFGGFCSKRAEIENVENTWLANSFTGTDPDDIDLTFDDAENTIFNNNYSFKIGNDVYQLTATGIYKNGVLQDIGGNTGIFNNNSMIFAQDNFYTPNHNSGPMFLNLASEFYLGYKNMYMPTMTDCKSNKKKKESVVANSNRRIDLKIAINSFWAFSSVKAKAVSFKKKNGNWKRARTNMAVSCGGTVYEGDCNGSFQFTTRKPSSGYIKRKHLKSPYRSQSQVPGVETNWKTYTGLLAGTIDAPDINVAGNVVLTF